jgi:aspartate kinase
VATHEHEALLTVLGDGPPSSVTTIVMKFGGASVADADGIRAVASRLVAASAAGARVVGVLSAMGQTTDELADLAHAVSASPDRRELDMLLSVGERVSCALVAMAINDLGREAISLTGSQAGIITDSTHGKARIVEVRARRIQEALRGDRIVLVAGFQGMSGEAKDITTLGQGGADATAVALASALQASACEIYTDAIGVFSADPSVVPAARRLSALSYDEMLELAASGARVVQLRSVELARNHGVALHVRSTFAAEPGTWITEESDQRMEKAIVSSIAHTADEAVYRVHGTTLSALFTTLADNNVDVDTILQTSRDAIVFSAPLEDRQLTAASLDSLGTYWSEYDELGKISLVGAGMKSHPGIAARTFQTLHDLGVEPQFVSTSPIKIAFYVPHRDVERTVAALHDAFELGAPPAGAGDG